MDWQEIIITLVGALCFGLTLRYFWQILRQQKSPCSGCAKSCPHKSPEHCSERPQTKR